MVVQFHIIWGIYMINHCVDIDVCRNKRNVEVLSVDFDSSCFGNFKLFYATIFLEIFAKSFSRCLHHHLHGLLACFVDTNANN